MKRPLSLLVLAALLWSPFANAADDDDDEGVADKETSEVKLDAPKLTSGRLAFVGGGVMLLGGFGVGYWAQGQAQAAQTREGALAARRYFNQAQSTAQIANMMYLLAGVAIVYGLALEVLPEPLANKANLTFHF